MFDIGFWELCLTAAVALVVIGPERLPKVAYEAGKWFGKLQRFVRNARFELERELHNYEIKQTLDKQKQELLQAAETAKEAVGQLKQDVEGRSGDITSAKSAELSTDSKKNER